MRSRSGFTMITVLWVMTVAGIVSMAAALAGRDSVHGAGNRVYLERAYWIAVGCAARMQHAIDATLVGSGSFAEAAKVWRTLDRAAGSAPLPAECRASLEAAGTRLDVNAASREMLENLFRAMDYGEASADLTSAVLDWRDSNAVSEPGGAERDWYAAAARFLPRDGPLESIHELTRVRGFEHAASFDSVLSVDPGRISLATAPVTVLLSVPGFGREVADRIVALRDAGTPPADITIALDGLSRDAVDAVIARYPDVLRVTTPDPDAWILTVRASIGLPKNVVVLERRLTRNGFRVGVVGTRSSL